MFTTLSIYLSVVTAISFLSSMIEAILLSTTHAYIALSVKQGRRSGRILDELKSNINRPLTAILALNTVSNTFGGALVGAHVQKVFGDKYLAIASGALTVLILLIGELIPKTLGASHWKALAPVAAYSIKALIFLFYPLVWLGEKLGRLIGADKEGSVSREEVIVTAELGADEGAIRQKESAIIKNLLMLDSLKVADIMTPRAVIYAFESGTTVADVMVKHRPIRFSRIPVYRDDLDHILGVVHRYKVLEAYTHAQELMPVDEFMTPVHTIPENISVAAALDLFIKRHEHVFVVLDDYGSTTGICSLEDAIETLLGVEIVDEFDSVADLRQYALEQWRERKQKLAALGSKS